MARRQASKRARGGSKEAVRRALSRGLVRSLVFYGSFKTTLARAKDLKPWVDELVTTARQGSEASQRRVMARLGQDNEAARALFSLVKQITGRTSGFVRIVKLGTRRGDAASMARVEWVDKVNTNLKDQNEKIQSKKKKAEK